MVGVVCGGCTLPNIKMMLANLFPRPLKKILRSTSCLVNSCQDFNADFNVHTLGHYPDFG